ncbi:MAG: R3H domain-containing nucleic acid-binding protein [Bacilli bacterium]
MITLHKYEGKNVEDLIKESLKDLKVLETDIYYIDNEIEGGLFKGKKHCLEVITKEEIIKFIKDFLTELSNKMNFDIKSEIRINKDVINVTLVSDNNNILIGKDGKNLSAIQILIRQLFHDLFKFHFKIMVDASNYKARRMENLEYSIKKTCNDVINTHIEVKLDPMNSYERRIVHTIVSEFDALQSVSCGEGNERYTVIRYKD